eukprot:CAMPEP_0171111702 /NCGR_PEP_ID=MMETSP0766_2-20121228/76241_1 /TAXON_ID=439317 /ORGANISM="Gambierdiscus australes, Strain CAWD 149" /LENGTH=232 /DNA_ID=CAMNT_0011573727 /DNA_START=75 /DNA_END=768 /DNA_ORIENTATION=-
MDEEENCQEQQLTPDRRGRRCKTWSGYTPFTFDGSEPGAPPELVAVTEHIKEEAASPTAWPQAPPPATITTLMIQNLPRHLCQRELLEELDRRGFAGRYDFCHLPMEFHTGRNKGFAFVNFVDAEVARSFQATVHESCRWGAELLERALRVVPAEVQGFKANAAKASSKKMRRVRNVELQAIARNAMGGLSAQHGAPHQVRGLAFRPARHAQFFGAGSRDLVPGMTPRSILG